ncbi:MAG: hypothetical protein IPM24_24670 [Bryobacterales bacterium]|nr:hypothetical protein [Bryobacterales bacterium]
MDELQERPELDVAAIVRQAVEEYAKTEVHKSEPAHKAELLEERRRREQLERRVNELVEENNRSRARAEEAERHAAIRAELQRLGVQKVDLAFKAVRDEVSRSEDGRLVGRSEQGEVELKDYLTGFVATNPEFLPARISGGSGVTAGQKGPAAGSAPVDLEKIRPGMSKEEMERVRQEILRVTGQTMRGL